jgi:hypothetical protein
MFNQAFEVAQKIEEVRCEFILLWNDFLRNSGAIVLLQPKFEHCLQAMFWKFSADMKDSIKTIGFYETEPFLEFKDKSLPTPEVMELARSYIELVRYHSKNNDYVNNLETTTSRLNGKISDEFKSLDKNLEQYGLSPTEIYAAKKKMAGNSKKIVIAGDVIGILRAIFNDIRYTMHDYSLRLKTDEEIYRLEEVGRDAMKKGLTKSSKIVWKYSIQDKISSFDDIYDIIDSDMEAEKYAKVYLGNARKKSGENSYIKELAKDVVRVPTQQSTVEDENYKVMSSEERIEIKPRKVIASEVMEVGATNVHVVENKLNKQQIETDIRNKEIQLDVLRDVSLKTGDTGTEEALEKLESELNELKIKNQELNQRLNEGSVIGGLEKLPIFVRQHVAYKNQHDLQFVKTAHTSTKNSIKCITPIQEIDCFALGDANGNILLFKFSKFEEFKCINISDKPVKSLLYMNDSKTLFSASLDGKIARVDLEIFTYTYLNGQLEDLRCLANPLNGYTIFSADGKFLSEWNIIDNKYLSSWEAHSDKITDLVYIQVRDVLVSSGNDKEIKIWNPITRECLGALEGHLNGIRALTFGNIGHHLNIVSIGKDNVITFWDLEDKDLTKSLRMKEGGKDVLYLHDCRSFMTIHRNDRLFFWNTEFEENSEIVIEDDIGLTAGCYFDDGYSILICTGDGKVILYN